MSDHVWGLEHIRGMLEGEILLTAPDATGRIEELILQVSTCFERRCAVLDGRAPLDELVDGVQMAQAISKIHDVEARAFMASALALGTMDADSASLEVDSAGLRSSRSLQKVYDRGLDLIRRNEKYNHSLLRRIRESNGMRDEFVCWRCSKIPVETPGMECEECASGERKRGAKPKSYDKMSINDIASTQNEPDEYDKWNRQIPGGQYYALMVSPRGGDPTDLESI